MAYMTACVTVHGVLDNSIYRCPCTVCHSLGLNWTG